MAELTVDAPKFNADLICLPGLVTAFQVLEAKAEGLLPFVEFVILHHLADGVAPVTLSREDGCAVTASHAIRGKPAVIRPLAITFPYLLNLAVGAWLPAFVSKAVSFVAVRVFAHVHHVGVFHGGIHQYVNSVF